MTARNNHCCYLVKFLKSPLSNCGTDGHGFYYTKQNKHPQFLLIGGKNMTARRISCFCLAKCFKSSFSNNGVDRHGNLQESSMDRSSKRLDDSIIRQKNVTAAASQSLALFPLEKCFWKVQPHSLSNIGSWGNMYQTVSPITTNLILGEINWMVPYTLCLLCGRYQRWSPMQDIGSNLLLSPMYHRIGRIEFCATKSKRSVKYCQINVYTKRNISTSSTRLICWL